ncbi:hypothetical protein CLPUN_22420 [Clostridium puniceum]|uniref:DUF1648 domain-containing protein n=1 Tax=Clostridium puniceum TaxID=29367 RepID=A0A1S8TIH3_9CLOT|nr:hypothetical protein CLPUN_22420 [Clostridium puniceum]
MNSLNHKKRPDLNISLTWKDKVIILIATVPIIFVLVYLKMVWSEIPEIIPTHFGFSGVPDDFGSKSSLFIIIIITISLHILLAVLSKVPKYYNYPVSITEKNVESLYKIGKQLMLLIDLEISFLFSLLIWENVQTALGKVNGVNSEILFLFIGTIFITLVYEIVKMYKVTS